MAEAASYFTLGVVHGLTNVVLRLLLVNASAVAVIEKALVEPAARRVPVQCAGQRRSSRDAGLLCDRELLPSGSAEWTMDQGDTVLWSGSG